MRTELNSVFRMLALRFRRVRSNVRVIRHHPRIYLSVQRPSVLISQYYRFTDTFRNCDIHYRVWRSRAVRLSRSSRFFMLAAASTMRASDSSVLSPSFCKLRSSSKHTNKNLNRVWSRDSHSCISVTTHNQAHVYMNFFPAQWPIISPPKILTLPHGSSCIST